MENKRNTGKEKSKRNLGFPYRSRINQDKWKVVDSNNKVYGKFREKTSARREAQRLNKHLFRDDFEIESI